MHVLLRLDTRITTRPDERLQAQILQELYSLAGAPVAGTERWRH